MTTTAKKTAKEKKTETTAHTETTETAAADATAQKATGPKAARETHQFQAETRKLLDIVIHSLYTNKEIFLRELISNSSDALDRLRFEALSNPELLGKDEELRIVIEPDPESRTLTVTDNGIGMSRDEVITNIGTIAKSGTRELMERIKESKSSEAVADLIGQFGVGFYSAFMVADRVKLITRRAGEDKATRWESIGDGQYTLGDDYSFRRGTSIVLFLKDVDRDNGIDDFTDFHVLQRIVKRYSDFVTYPIVCKHRQMVMKPEGKAGEGGAGLREQTLNSMKPIWTRPSAEVTKEEYAEFYKHISHDWNEPFHPPLSLRAEGRIEYQALLFLPQKSPFDLFFRDQQWGLHLYVRRVLIMERCEDILPPYLRFIRGVVDSADLPLNISRETIQQDRLINQMKKWLTRKVIDHLKEWKEKSNDEYLQFWKELGRVLKEGVSHEPENRERLLPLLYFPSSNDPEKLTTLAEYVERMKEDQDDIYYMTGESRAQIETSPHLEAFKEKGYEVLYMTDPVDEFMTQAVDEYEDHKLKSVGKGKVELGSDEEIKKAREELKKKQASHKDLMELLQKKLDEWVKEVRLSTRLTSSPVCLVGGDWDMSPQMERMMRQTDGSAVPRQKRILELNPNHEILVKLQERFDKDKEDPKLEDYAHLLLGYALLAEGSDLPEPARYNKLVGELMLMGL